MNTARAELIAVGSELLGPHRLDTNGSFLAERLEKRGITVRFRTIVGDDEADLREAFRIAMGRAGHVIATGGLGPTVDDLTREAVAGLLGRPLEEDPRIAGVIEARFRRHGYAMPERNLRQAMVPRGAIVLENRLGTAPGLVMHEGGTIIALLPGVPAEMRPMVDEGLLPLLLESDRFLAHRVLKISGLTESEADRRLFDIYRTAAPVEWTILASPGQIEIHLREAVAGSMEASGISRLEAAITEELGAHLFGHDDETLESIVGGLLKSRGGTLAVAESITGGAVARRLTAIPGASQYFRGGAVCYSDDAKMTLAGVTGAMLAAHGAVSEEVAREMAEGIRVRLRATWGLATTGYAGPESGGHELPPGTLYIAVASPVTTLCRRLLLPGDRALVQERSSQAALDALRRCLLDVAEAGA